MRSISPRWLAVALALAAWAIWSIVNDSAAETESETPSKITTER